MMIRIACILSLLLGPSAILTAGVETLHDSSVLLWQGGAPEARGTEITDQPGLTIHLPSREKATGAAVVVNPGGAFTKLASDNEGLHVARWLNSVGVTAFVLRYRLMPDYGPSVALLDAQRAIRYVRHNAETFGIDPDRIGMLGFSAGGHLASGAAIRFDAGNPAATDPIDRVSSRPDFVVLVYAGIARELPDLVTADSPPAFLVLSHEDSVVSPKHALPFYEALLDNEVQVEMHVFGRGAHGAGMAPGDPALGQWPTLLVRWLRTSGFLTGAERIPVKGVVTIDGEPLLWGGVAFISEDPNAPIVWTYSLGGKLSIDAANGPVPGSHRVEVHILSKDFSEMKSGKYSTDDSECYTRTSPGAKGPLTVEIAADKEIRIAITTQ
jgi:acetyl esterase/lipase